MRRPARISRWALLFLGIAAPALADAPLAERIAAASASLSRAPFDAQALLERGTLYREAGEWDRARRDLGLAAHLNPTLAPIELERAALELDAGRPIEALAAAQRAVKALPASGDAERLAARAFAETGDFTSAAASMRRAVEHLDPLAPEDILECAEFQERAGTPGSVILAGLEKGIQRLGPAVSLVKRANALRASHPGPALAPAAAFAPRFSTRPASPGSGRAKAADRGVRVVRGPYLQQGTTHSIVVRWRTDAATDSRVSYGTSLSEDWTSVHDATLTTEHEVRIDGLHVDTHYLYSIGYSAEGGAAQTLAGGNADFSFSTAPPDGSTGPTRIWVIGDSGSANRDARAVRDAWVSYSGGRPPDVWLMLGDNAYNSGTDGEYQRAVFEMYARQLASSVLWPTRGNHDVLHDGPSNDYYEYFTLPSRAEAGGLPSGSEAYYSFDYANVHFVCLDSEGSPRGPGSAMLTWLAEDLAETKLPWIISYWHHPPYSKGSHDSDDAGDSGRRLVDMREFALPVLEAGGVDLVLCGHSHAYERSFLLNGHYGASSSLVDSMKIDAGDGRETGDGPYTKKPGAAGRPRGAVYTVAGSSGKTSGGSLDHPVMVTSLNVLGSLVIDVNGKRLDASFLDSSGDVRDAFSIVKDGSSAK